jgi:hypothetical protein
MFIIKCKHIVGTSFTIWDYISTKPPSLSTHFFHLRVRCHTQTRAICADIEEVQTTNSKGSAEQAEESNPALARQGKTAHQSAQKGGTSNNWVDCSLSASLQSHFSTLRITSFWARMGCTPMMPSCGRWTETVWVKGSDTLAEFYATDV